MAGNRTSEYTRTQVAILSVLADGGPHTVGQLLARIGDSQMTAHNLRCHLSILRKKLRPIGQDILCVKLMAARSAYRQVALIGAAATIG